MLITPTKEHGPIAGKKLAPGKWEVFEPGQAFECDDRKAKLLIQAGKAAEVEEVTVPPKPKPRKKASKKKEKKDAGSN
jgi:hypothetical protein